NSAETIATTPSTTSDVVRVNLVFRRSRMRLPPRRLVSLELVVQGLQADAEQLGSARLVLVGRSERLQDELVLGRLDRCADREAQACQLRCPSNSRGAAEIGRQVMASNQTSIAGDRGA